MPESGEWLPGRWGYPSHEPLSLSTRGRANLLGLVTSYAVDFRGVEDLDKWAIEHPGNWPTTAPSTQFLNNAYWGNLGQCGICNEVCDEDHIGRGVYAYHELENKPNFVTSIKLNNLMEMLYDVSGRGSLRSNFIFDLKQTINNIFGWYPWTRPDYTRNVTITDLTDIRAAIWRRGNDKHIFYYYKYVIWGQPQSYMGMDKFDEELQEWVWDREGETDAIQLLMDDFKAAYRAFPESEFYLSTKPNFQVIPLDWAGCDPDCFGDCDFCSESDDIRIHGTSILGDVSIPDYLSISSSPTLDREYSRVSVTSSKVPCQDNCQDHRHALNWMCSVVDANPKTAFWYNGYSDYGFLTLFKEWMEYITYGLAPEPLPTKEVQFLTHALRLNQMIEG